ncbi:DUF862-domain-containing protein [Dendrothele bispora CBS 962.96]|uniref:DUF862-domain-containing protein n=1 Tax=Dendrothele bispora (strain CBS 962.96) TaxID=1314807 RepID=A0A4S8MNN3_DENBC|nr:DUF862-domain-containing protein [Dendrothele bispora CBS 962.96]
MAPVQLYVYDLSNGLAKQLSMAWTGRQIDGIWHTSIVVFGKEVFYGQGINITAPGKSHHGQPLQIVDLGETSIDEDTFNEYLDDIKSQYTAENYHLLDFNCNSFTNDCAGFLTGNAIPDYIKDLPTDFLSTPFGAALRPTIDAMYRQPTPGATPQSHTPAPSSGQTSNPALAASLLQAVAAQAQQRNSSSSAAMNGQTPLRATESLTGALHPCTNSASFQSLLRTHKAVVACFSNIITCPPCRTIAPIYEQLAQEKGIKTAGGRGAAFTKIDLSVSSGQALGAEWGVRVMPTFMFFLDGKKISEMKGADANELRTQVDLLLFQAYPPHPHTSLSLPAMQALSLSPILFSQVPALDTVFSKLSSFIDSATWPSTASQSQSEIKQVLSSSIVPYLKSRFAPVQRANGTTLPSASSALLTTWAQITFTLTSVLPPESLFPVVDMWRLAMLDPAVGAWYSTVLSSPTNPISLLLSKTTASLDSESDSTTISRPYILTFLRLLCNAFSSPILASRLLVDPGTKSSLTTVLVKTVLHKDGTVRTAAASLMFDVSSFVQKLRVDKVVGNTGNSGLGLDNDGLEEEDWEVEMVSAIVEAVGRENGNEDVVHRLVASLGCLLRLSPFYESSERPLLEIVQAKEVLKSKLVGGGCGEKGVGKKEVRKLIEEVAEKLCP